MKTRSFKRNSLALTLAFLLTLALITSLAGCTKDTDGGANTPLSSAANTPVASGGTPVPDGRGDLTPDNSGRGDLITENPGSGNRSTPDWDSTYYGEEYVIEFSQFDGTSFWFEFTLFGGTDRVMFSGTANIHPDDDHMAESDNVWFYINDDNTIVEVVDVPGSEWKRLNGYYNNLKYMGDPGTDPIPWDGSYRGDEYAVEISLVGDTSFWFEITHLRNGKKLLEGPAYFYQDNDLMAKFGAISFSLYEDYSAIDIFVSDSSEWAHLHGHYIDTYN